MRSAEELWLETLQRISACAAHELRGALNGVSLNLEVLRTRALRDDLVPGSLQRFADGASVQNDAVIEMAEALLALARAPRLPVDVGIPLAQIAALVAPSTRGEGRGLTLVFERAGPTVTAAPASAVRLVLGIVLLAASSSERNTTTQCTCSCDPIGSPQVSIVPALSEGVFGAEVEGVLSAAAISHHTDGHGSFIVFPPA